MSRAISILTTPNSSKNSSGQSAGLDKATPDREIGNSLSSLFVSNFTVSGKISSGSESNEGGLWAQMVPKEHECRGLSWF